MIRKTAAQVRAATRVILVTFWSLMALGASAAEEGPTPITNPTAEDLAMGRKLFASQCARCHGYDGGGGQGPSLKRSRLRRAPDDAALLSVIQDGVPNTSMPGAWQLSTREVARVGAYVRTFGRLPDTPLPGDVGRGRALFEGKGGCAVCHIVGGKGGSLGPELTEVGSQRGPEHLRRSLVDPGAEHPPRPVSYEPNAYAGYLLVRVALRDGRVVSGYRVNEDTFTIQLRDAAGTLHSLRKGDLARLEKQLDQSSMPAYGTVLSGGELDDLVAYLASLRGES
jgi:cytochrome c oxidase cbb3-type subunit III